ncbi:circadian clock-controlled protein daywake-like [Arctopsyche grandis]|uniref:circadian clock-controlled protein daywake-like n=1 Tax=Arctopsyche grandis TaxID=121162 RepID=UPI00406D6AEA
MSRANIINFVFLSLCLFDYAYSAKLPSSVTPCKRNNPDLDNCVLMAARKFQKEFTSGIPALGIPKMDPYTISGFNLDTGDSGFKMNFLSSYLRGFKDAKIENLKFDLNAKTLILETNLDAVADTKYNATGKIMQFPFNGLGNFTMGLYGLQLKLRMKWDFKKGSDNKNHIEIKSNKAQYKVDTAKFTITGLLNEEMDAAMSNLLDSHWRILEREVAPSIVKFLEENMRLYLNDFFSKIAYDDLFPM